MEMKKKTKLDRITRSTFTDSLIDNHSSAKLKQYEFGRL